MLREEEEKRKKVEGKLEASKRDNAASEAASSTAQSLGRELDEALRAKDAAKREVEELRSKVRSLSLAQNN